MEARLRQRLRRIYVDGWEYWTEPPDYMDRKLQQVEALRVRAAELFERPATVQTRPENVNNYYDIECPLNEHCSESMAALDYDRVQRYGPCEYFQLVCSVVAPVVAGVWHRFLIRDGAWNHDMFDFLSDHWFAMHDGHDAIALELIAAVEELGLTVLGWDMTLKPADNDWPLSRYMPVNPDLRHFLFPGYYDDWGGIVKPVRDT